MSMAALVAFSGVFVLGVIFAILGSIKLKLAEILQIDDAQVGKLFSALMFSGLIASLVIGPLTDMLGYGIIAALGFALSGISLWLLAAAISYRSALIACLLLGIGAIGVNTGNVLGPTVLFGGQDPSRASNLLNILFGLGALLTPLVMAFLLGRLGYKKTVAFLGLVLFVPVILPRFAELPTPGAGFDAMESMRLLANPAVLLGGMGLFCSIAIQSSLAGFVTSYLKSYEFSDEKAGALLSGFWIALILSRVVATAAPPSIAPGIVLPIVTLLMAVSIALMIVTRSAFMAALFSLLAGFFLGPIFPTLVGESLSKTNAIGMGTAGSVFGLIFAMGLCGGIVVPTMTGKHAVRHGIRKSLRISLGVSLVLVLIGSMFYFVPTVEADLPDDVVDEAPISAPQVHGVGLVDPDEAETVNLAPDDAPPLE